MLPPRAHGRAVSHRHRTPHSPDRAIRVYDGGMEEPTTPTLSSEPAAAQAPRPVEDSYWVVPGRLLVGGHPGSRSRAQSMERLRRFLEAGITHFVDLTEEHEAARYELLLPYEAPGGQRIEYLRAPIVDHAVP